MEPKLDWISIINIAGAINGLFFSLVILGIKHGNKTIKRILAGLIFSLVFIIISSIMLTANLYFAIPHLFGIFPNFYLMVGPMLFLYVKGLTTSNFRFRFRYALHFLPFILYIIKTIPFYMQDSAYKLEYLKSFLLKPGDNSSPQIYMILRLVHLFVYLCLTVRIIQRHRRSIKNSHSSIEKIKLSWLLYLIFIFASILATYIIFVIFLFSGKNTFLTTGRVFTLWEPLMVFFIGYKGLTQTEISAEKTASPNNQKYLLSNLTREMSEKYRQRLIKYMKKEKPHLDSELTLKELSGKISISTRHLSQLLNETFNQNFFDFVNHFRVEEAKSQLIQSQDKTILQIAFESGFNSKTAFNTAFKKYAGETPSQYRQQQKKNIHL